MTRLFWLLALVVALPVLMGVVFVQGTGGGGGPGPTQTLYDDFEGDITGWAARSGSSACANQGAGTTLEIADEGACHYSGVSEGTPPTDEDSWAIVEFANTAPFRGPGIRAKSTAPGNTDYNFVARGDSNGDLMVRSCDTDYLCTTIGAVVDVGETSDPDDGDQMAIGAGGGVGSEVVCVWFWESASQCTGGCDVSDPSTWGDADMCKSATAGWTELSDYHDCDGAQTNTDCQASQTFNSPAVGQTDVTLYSGTASGAVQIEWFRAGDF